MLGTQGQIRVIPLTTGETSNSARDMSADGKTIVGTANVGGVTTTSVPYYWNAEEGSVELGLLPGFVYGEAVAVSADGSVISGYNAITGTTDSTIFRWENGALTDLAMNAQTPFMSADGSRIVVRDIAAAKARIWNDGVPGFIDLEIPPNPTGSIPCIPGCISGDGLVIGGCYSKFVGSQTFPAVLWSGVDGSILSVMTLPVGWVGACFTSLTYDGSKGVGRRNNDGQPGDERISKSAKTITGLFDGQSSNIFTWTGGTTLTTATVTNAIPSRLPRGGSQVRLIAAENQAMFPAGNGLVYAMNRRNPANLSLNQALRVSMLVRNNY